MTSGPLFTSYFRSPKLTETMRRKKVRSFIRVTLLFSVNDRILREICESQTSVISVPDLALADRAIYRARVLKTHKRPPQNTRDKGNLIFHSYSGKNGWESSLCFCLLVSSCNCCRASSSRCSGLALSHGLVLHIGLTSMHLSPLYRIVQEKLL